MSPDSKNNELNSPALARLRRLERQERDRIAGQIAVADQRAQLSEERRGPNDSRRMKLDALEHKIRFPMAALGIAWGVSGIIALSAHSKGSSTRGFVIALFVIWVFVVIEYVVRYIAVPDRKRYFACRQIEPVMIALPIFQIWRLFGVERTTVFWGEGIERFIAILRHRGLFRVLLAAAGLVFLGAWLDLLFERHAVGSNIHSYYDSLWWAVVTVTTVGYGDRFPVTEGGRAVAVVLMMVGIGLIGVLTATVASFFVQEHADANKDQLKAAHEDLGARISDINDRLARMEALLVGSPATPTPTTPTPPNPPPSP